MTIAIGAMSLQSAKLQLINVAAMVASAVARGEPDELIDQLVATAGEQVAFELEELEDSICVKLSVAMPIAGIELGFLELAEKQCARASGQ
jgi:O-succinylbenzoate synthase